MGNILFFHGDPAVMEYCPSPIAVAVSDALFLGDGVDRQKYRIIVVLSEHRMQGIGALYEGDGFWLDRDRVTEALRTAGKGAVGKDASLLEWRKDLGKKTLVVNVLAGCRQPFGCPLFRAQKEIVHVDQVGIEALG